MGEARGGFLYDVRGQRGLVLCNAGQHGGRGGEHQVMWRVWIWRGADVGLLAAVQSFLWP
jgi:hypothetical protein